jgi:Ethanolamine utilization protein EutJ (predicted chaperonin)
MVSREGEGQAYIQETCTRTRNCHTHKKLAQYLGKRNWDTRNSTWNGVITSSKRVACNQSESDGISVARVITLHCKT